MSNDHSDDSEDSDFQRQQQQQQWQQRQQRQQQRFRELEEAINDRQSLNLIESIIDEDPAILEYQDEEKHKYTILHTMMDMDILPSQEIIDLLVLKGPNAFRKQN